MLYFAYGSNMSGARFKKRVPSAVPKDTGFLYGHKLVFHKISVDGSGKCDAYETNRVEDCLAGIVYKIAPFHRNRLDRIERVGSGYEPKEVKINTLSGDEVVAFTYYATRINRHLHPYH
jgi:hypothetical protein